MVNRVSRFVLVAIPLVGPRLVLRHPLAIARTTMNIAAIGLIMGNVQSIQVTCTRAVN